MAQIVIFAPKGEDVSAGESALKDAGHDVEVVEATAENLLHMAIGMLGGATAKDDESSQKEDEESDEEPSEDPLADEEPVEEDPSKMESLGTCSVDGELVEAVRGKRTQLFTADARRGDETITFTLNESVITTRNEQYRFFLETPKGEIAGVSAPIYRSKFGKSYLVVGPALAQYF